MRRIAGWFLNLIALDGEPWRCARGHHYDDPDPAAVLAGAATAYLEEHAPTLFNDLSLTTGDNS